MKTRNSPIVFLLAGAAAWTLAGGALGQDRDEIDKEEKTVKLGGLEIRRTLVNVQEFRNDKGEASYLMSESFRHGTRSLRLKIRNTSDAPVGLCAEIPLRTGHSYGLFDSTSYMRLTAETHLAPASEQEWNIPVPCVANLAMDFGDEGGWSFAASTGESVRGTYALHDGGRNHLYTLLNKLPRTTRRCEPNEFRCRPLIAVSPAMPRREVNRLFRRARFFQMGRGRHGRQKARENAPEKSDKELDGELEKSFSAPCEIILPDYRNFRVWQDLSGYDLFVIRDTDWPKLGETFHRILPDWVASGGSVAFVGESFDGMPAAGAAGLGRIAHCADDTQLVAQIADLADAAAQTQCLRGLESTLESAQAAHAAELAFRGETPFALILLVLAAFTVVAGPVVVAILAKKNKRINLLWVFPLVSVLFSIAVAAVCVFAKGLDPELRQFVYTVVDEHARKVVTVQDDVLMAPIPVSGELRYSAQGTLAYSCGDTARAGESVVFTGDEFVFRHGWTPALWPVVFRTVRVWDIADGAVQAVREAAKAEGLETPEPLGVVTCPFAGRLQSRTIEHKVERRAAP